MTQKVAVVTGAGKIPGIGSHIAKLLLFKDINVVINAQRSFDITWQNEDTNRILMIAGDISDSDIQQHLIDSAMTKWGRIDYLINNASTGKAINNNDPTRKCWEENFLLNVIVPWELSMKAFPYMSNSNGSIVNISSRAALNIGAGNNVAYAVSKSALNDITKRLASLLAPTVTVNAICPGLTESVRLKNIFGADFETKKNQYIKKSLIKSSVSFDDISNTVWHLLTTRNINGQIIPVCGGASLV